MLEAVRAIRQFMRLLRQTQTMAAEGILDATFGETLAKSGHVLDQAEEALLSLSHVEDRWVFEATAMLRAHFNQLCRDASIAQRHTP
jgi:hypothetical protein